jgi:carboxyl-terminal processing protease
MLIGLGIVAELAIIAFLPGRGVPYYGLQGLPAAIFKGADDDKISYTMSLIESLYVDPVSADSLAEIAIPLILRELDPHSVYIPAAELAETNEPLEGNFDGIGVMFNMLTDTVVVLNVIPLGPSDKAGVQNGDRIVRIDDSLVAGRKIRQDDIVKRLRGARGTTVTLGIERSGNQQLVPIVVERGVIPIKAIDAAFMIRPGVGFVKLSTFSRVSFVELQRALSELTKQGMESLIFDLRGNGGGYLDQAIAIANMFLPADELIVYTEDRNGHQIKEFSNGNGSFTTLPLVMLIDEGSASSSEILAGAIQDNDRGTIVGRRSFGKGLVQREIQYPDGAALRLTVARYYTPAGRSIQKPYDKGADEYHMDIANRFYHSEMFSADSIRQQDTVRYFTRAGRVVYGGGGIMPDHFVSIDTLGYTAYLDRVSDLNLIYRFTLDWGDRHRERMNSIASVADLDAMFAAAPDLVNDFVSYAARNGVHPDYKDIAISRRVIEAQLRALIGRNTALDYTGFYAEIYPIDSTIGKALEVLESK